MRLLGKIFFIVLLSFPLGGYIITPIDTPSIYITSDNFGPLNEYQDDIEIPVVIHSNSKTKTFHEDISCGPSKSDIKYHKSNANRNITNYTYQLTFKLPTSDYLSRNGMYCSIKLLNNKDLLLSNYEFTLYPIVKNKTINPANYKTTSFKTENISYRFDTFGLIKEAETFSFPDYLSFLNIDVYHRLDVSGLSFVTSSKSPMYSSAYINIPDYDFIFPYINHYGSNFISIPLKVVKDDNGWRLAYSNTMYVHPKLGYMSLSPRDGFVTTRYFYFPVNQKEKMIDQKISFRINDLGIGKTNVVWSLDYLANLSLIGKCNNSQYCVVGEEL